MTRYSFWIMVMCFIGSIILPIITLITKHPFNTSFWINEIGCIVMSIIGIIGEIIYKKKKEQVDE